MSVIDLQLKTRLRTHRVSDPIVADESTQITLVIYWSATSLHCLRLLPYLKRWWELYHPSGLSMSMVIAAEYSFEKIPTYISELRSSLGLPWPVALKSTASSLNDLSTVVLPRLRLLGRDGSVLYDGFGEGYATDIELAIRQALFHTGQTQLPPPTHLGEHQHSSGKQCFPTYPDIHLGANRAYYKNIHPIESDAKLMVDPLDATTYGASLSGHWSVDAECLRSTPQTSPEAYLSVVFVGFELLAVLAPVAAQPCSVTLTLNGQPLAATESGLDVQYQSNQSVLQVDRARMYQLVASQQYLAPAELRLHLTQGHLAAYAITTSGCRPSVDG